LQKQTDLQQCQQANSLMVTILAAFFWRNSNFMKYLILFVPLLLLVGCSVETSNDRSQAPVQPSQASGTRIGDTVPEITGKDSSGVTFSLSDYRGKVVMLDFWGDW
jgi:cytochrome oxidase Cu insertion factor (SCO1/SenC/PrrC family)